MTKTITKTKKLRPFVKIHGGKYYLSQWLISHFPENYQEMEYLEAFCGAASALLNKEESKLEAISETNLGLVQILRALRDESKHFISRLRKTKYCENTFFKAIKRNDDGAFDDYMDHAVNEFILRRMSRGGHKKSFSWSKRKRGGQPGDVNAWKTILEQLPEIAARVENIYILHDSAFDILKSFNSPDTFCYVDPPYLPSTRTSPDSYGEDELTTEQHIELSEILRASHSKIMISGYPSSLYKRLYDDWRSVEKRIANHSSQQKKKSVKRECIWMNY